MKLFFTVVVSFLTFSLLSQPIEFSCVDTLDLDGATIVDGTYNASQIISSNNVIKPGSAVNFRAGQRIELKPGFHAQAGSSFTASIDAIPCTPATLIDGSYTRPNPIPDSLIAYYDRWGNGYSDFELQHFTIVEECNSSYFNLLFSGQFTDSEQSTICDVFSYLATTITPAVPDPEITIRVVKGVTTDPGTLAFGSPYWDAEECGIANSVIERILIGGDPSRYGREHGYILVNEDFDGEWYTGEQASRDGLYDLYTVILHEAMHVLGFASRISDKMGTPLGADQGNNAYSRFDQFLYSDSINAFLINSVVSPTECCDEHTFNSSTSDNIRPSCGNHLFFRSDGNNIAPINGNNSQVLNLLSHFNETCGGEPYVMRPGIARGEARDVLTPAELEVLRSIGYVVNSLPPPCDVIAVEDIIVQELQSPVTTFTIPVSNLTSNDVFPINGTFTYNEACGEQENLIISFDGTAFSIDATEAGTYTLCYTITGCNNEVCDQGTFKIILLNPVEESCTDCDIVCIGDFESFSSREEMQLRLAGNFGFNADAYLFSFYQAQNSPDFHRTFDLFLSNFSCDETVSIDQFGLEGEQFGAFYGTLFSDGTVDKEGMVFELSEPIQPGEEAEISFIAWTDMLCGLSSPYITVEFLASDPILGEVVYANPGISGTSVNIDISNDYPPTYRQADIVNNTSDTWRYVILSPLFQNLPPGISIFQTYAYIDDITLIKKKAIAISSPVSDFVCPGDVIPVDFELCNPHPSLSPELVLDLTLPSGVTLLNAGTFGDGISATLPEGTIAENGCYTVTAFIRIEETVTIGQPLDIQLDIAPGGCYSPSTFTKTITPVDNPLTINKNYTQIGNQFTFTIQVCNTLNQALDNVYIEDRFPPGFTVNNPGGYTISGNIASQTISIPANSCRTRFYTGTLPAGYCPDTYCATAEIEGNGCGRVRECVELNTSAIIPPDAGFTYNLNCNTLTLTFTSASTDPTASHFWNFGDGTTSTTANPSRTYAATGSYPVLHTVSNGCEEVVEEMLVVVDDCTANFTCGCVNTSFNIGDPAGGTTLFSNTGLPASLPGNTCLAIAGTLVIDSDFSVNQGTIYMQPGAEIRIPSGQMLTLDDVMVQGCPNEMWQSITVEDGGRLVMRFSNVLDAIAAVSLQDGAEAELMDNVFNRNYIGLDITGVPVLFPEGNLFTCTANLNDGRWGFAGVRVQDGTFITGSSSGVVFLNNIFQNTDYGIWADNSFIAVCDATFNNFRRVSGGTGRVDKSGTGVYARRSSALINMNTFTNSYHAIFTEECHLQLNNNDISTTNIGMLLLSPLWKFEAKENDMECSHIGIEVSHPVTTLVQDLLKLRKPPPLGVVMFLLALHEKRS